MQFYIQKNQNNYVTDCITYEYGDYIPVEIPTPLPDYFIAGIYKHTGGNNFELDEEKQKALNSGSNESLTFTETKLKENSDACKQAIEMGFKSAAKGDGLQPYRMNGDDQTNLSGYVGMINTALILQQELPLFSWQNANQTKCVDDWTHGQILALVMEFGIFKTKILKRQDDIKDAILNAEESQLGEIVIDYSDLLNFEG